MWNIKTVLQIIKNNTQVYETISNFKEEVMFMHILDLIHLTQITQWQHPTQHN